MAHRTLGARQSDIRGNRPGPFLSGNAGYTGDLVTGAGLCVRVADLDNDGSMVESSVMATTAVGTLEWVDHTNGALRPQDRVRLLAQFAGQLPLVPSEVLSRLGRPSRQLVLLPPQPAPSSSIAEKAEELCRAATKHRPWVHDHSVRTFGFAQLFAQRAGVEFDLEVLWVASMLHDVALGEGATTSSGASPCFAVRGATGARSLAQRHGWSDEAQRRLAEAITLHLNLRVTRRRSVEGHLLNLGSALDVAGMRARRVASAAMTTVLAEHPNDGFPFAIRRLWNMEAAGAPQSRTRFLRHVGLGLLIRTSPLRRPLPATPATR